MLATRIIPTLLCRGRQLIKGQQYNSWRSVGHVQQGVRVMAQRGADELALIDIRATPDARLFDQELLGELADKTFMPLAVGGGISSLEHASTLLRNGADKIIIGQAAWDNPYLVSQIAERYGSQAVVVAIDAVQEMVWTHCATKPTNTRAVVHAINMETMGAGEILITDITREGMLNGYNIELIHQVGNAVRLPVIAHGGAGSYNDLLQGVLAGASAVAAGALFQWTEATPKGAAEYLYEQGIETRRSEDDIRGRVPTS